MKTTQTPNFPPIPEWDPNWSETSWDPAMSDRLDDYIFDVIIAEPRHALENLALDVALQRSVAEGRRKAVMWLWDWAEPAVVLGSYQSVGNEIDPDGLKQNRSTFVRRMSGGGAMIVEPKRTITYSLITPLGAVDGLSHVQAFAYMDRWAVRALRGLGIPATYNPINDIASPTAKIGGAAQARRWGTMLHHVTMAYAFNPQLLTGLLRLGKPKLATKGTPSAEKQVSPISDFTDMPHDEFRRYLAHTFTAQYRTRESAFTPKEEADAKALIEEKLGTNEWLYRVE